MFLGKLLFYCLDLGLYPMVFASGYYAFIQSNSGFLNYFATFLFLQLSVSSLSFFLSVIVPVHSRSLFMIAVCVILWLFAGVSPKAKELPTTFPILGPALNALSPFRWSHELQLCEETKYYQASYRQIVDAFIETYSYDCKDIPVDQGWLVFYSFCFCLGTCGLILLKRNDWLQVFQTYGEFKLQLIHWTHRITQLGANAMMKPLPEIHSLQIQKKISDHFSLPSDLSEIPPESLTDMEIGGVGGESHHSWTNQVSKVIFKPFQSIVISEPNDDDSEDDPSSARIKEELKEIPRKRIHDARQFGFLNFLTAARVSITRAWSRQSKQPGDVVRISQEEADVNAHIE